MNAVQEQNTVAWPGNEAKCRRKDLVDSQGQKVQASTAMLSG